MNQTGLEQELQQLQNVYTLITEFLVKYSFQLVGALIIFCIGLWIASKVSRLLLGLFKKHNIDITLATFVASAVRILIIVLIGIIALGKLGISVTPLVAAIGAISLGAGLAFAGHAVQLCCWHHHHSYPPLRRHKYHFRARCDWTSKSHQSRKNHANQ